MKKLQIMNNVTRTFHKVGFQLKKHSPEILVVAGVIGTVTSTVMACKATTKVNAILEEAKETIGGIHAVAEKPENAEVYDQKDINKALTITYVKTGLELAKLYGPAVILGAVSITSIVASHRILTKRNVALAAAYTAVDTGFKEYRGRVIERFGKELDRELKYNIKTKEVEETVVDEKGKEKKVKKTIEVADPTAYSGYARCFDETCTGWERDSEYNLMFLLHQQQYANDMLKSRGHLYLNEVYDMLGMQRSKAGQIVGWVYDEENPVGDNYVDFGIHDLHDESKRAFVNGYEKSIWIDPNVDGNIYELMK